MEARYSLVSLEALGASTAYEIEQAHRDQPLDFVLSVHPDPLAYADLEMPCGFIGDCNFALLAETYPGFRAHVRGWEAEGERMWRRGLQRSEFGALASSWAVEDTRRRYPELSGRLRELPFGANVRSTWDAATVARRIDGRKLRPLRLLTVGTEWERKGMAETMEVVRHLRAAGVDARLDVVGCHAPGGTDVPEGVTIHGRLNRGDPVESRRLEQLYEEAHVFILGSRAECFGIVFGEAGSYGLPSVAVASCGITSAVRDGSTGRLFSSDDWGCQAAGELAAWVASPGLYARYAHRAWQDANDRLDWSHYASRLVEWMHEAVERRTAAGV